MNVTSRRAVFGATDSQSERRYAHVMIHQRLVNGLDSVLRKVMFKLFIPYLGLAPLLA